MPSPQFETAVRRRVVALNRRLADEVSRLRLDAGLSRLAVARAAGISDAYLGRIEDGGEHPSAETLVRIGLVLGADLSAHLYPNTGPAIHDRWAAPMLELLLASRHPRWEAFTEVAVHRPSRGSIDLVLHERRERVAVATELQGDLRRLEQLVRWQTAKAESLPSWAGWTTLEDPPDVSRLLVVRRTRATRTVVADFGMQLREVFPAHPDDAVAALTGTQRWPGAALVWVRVEGARARFAGGR
jgi:transcriptional regulator with XRE-family HTH domain